MPETYDQSFAQPDDETPLPDTNIQYQANLFVPREAPLYLDELIGIEKELTSSIKNMIDETRKIQTDNLNEINLEIAKMMGSSNVTIDDRLDDIRKQIKKIDSSIVKTLNDAESYIIPYVPNYPLWHMDRVEALSQEDDGYFQNNYINDPPYADRIESPDVCILCNSYPPDPIKRVIGTNCQDTNTGEWGVWAPDPNYEGYVILKPLDRDCTYGTPTNTVNPVSRAGDPCFDYLTNQDGILYPHPDLPGYLICRSTPPDNTPPPQLPTSPFPGSNPMGGPPGVQVGPIDLPPSPPLNVPIPTDPPLIPTVPPTYNPVPPTVVPPTYNPDGTCPPTLFQCPTPIIQCPQPVINVTVQSPITNTTTNVSNTQNPPTIPPPSVPQVTTKPTEEPPEDSEPSEPTIVDRLVGDAAIGIWGMSVDWASELRCEGANRLCVQLQLKAEDPKGGFVDRVSNPDNSFLGIISEGLDVLVNPVSNAYDFFSDIFGEVESTDIVGNLFAQMWKRGGALGKIVLDSMLPAGVHNKPAATYFCSATGLANFVTKWTGIPVDYYLTSHKYSMQFCDPQYIIGQTDIDNLFLIGEMNEKEWECLTKAQGNIPSIHKRARDGKQRQLGENEVISLKRRKLLKDDDEYYKLMNKDSVIDRNISDRLYKLSEYVPTYSDLVPWMVRDVFDKEVVEKYQYDKHFKEKYLDDPKAQEFAEAAGITEDVMRYIWRAHWKIISNTQLLEALHRLRPDRPEVEQWESETTNPLTGEPMPVNEETKPIVVTSEDVRTALEINDVAPTWVDALMATSYHPLTATDGVRSFQIGTIDEDGLYHIYRDNGYNEKDAREVVRFRVAERNRMVSNSSGVMTTRKIVSAYKDGIITHKEAMNRLQSNIVDHKVREEILDKADRELEIQTKKCQLDGLQKRFVYGEIDDEQLSIELSDIGIDQTKIDRIVNSWICKRDSRRKEPRVKMLGEWYAQGFITGDQYFERLIRLGYNGDDAARIAGTMHNNEVVRRAKQSAIMAEKNRKEFFREMYEQKRDIQAYIDKRRAEYEEIVKSIKIAQAELNILKRNTQPLTEFPGSNEIPQPQL